MCICGQRQRQSLNLVLFGHKLYDYSALRAAQRLRLNKEKMGKPKYIETPEKMWELFEGYKGSLTPRAIEKATPRGVITEMHTPPLTYEGFMEFGFQNGVTIDHYFRNTNDAYKDYCGVCSRIKNAIRRDQIEGGMVGQYNPSITQRLNSLTERTDVTTNGQEIGNKIEIEIIRKGKIED